MLAALRGEHDPILRKNAVYRAENRFADLHAPGSADPFSEDFAGGAADDRQLPAHKVSGLDKLPSRGGGL
jgi:hypothetical protein